MVQKYILNRLHLTGKLTEKTPSCVIIEIGQAHNLFVNKKINTITEHLNEILEIEKYKYDTLEEPLNERKLRSIAFFVNRNSTSWTKSSLIQAYEHMMNFNREDLSSLSYGYGQKTYENPLVFNSCMLYNLCLHHNIKTSWNTTTDEMLNSLVQLRMSFSNLQNQLYSLLSKSNKATLINLINVASLETSKIRFETPDTATPKKELPPIINLEVEELQKSLDRFKDTSYLLKQINPKSHSDAIILAALVYNLNITESSIPFSEYNNLKQVKNLDLYTPIDINFRSRYLRNPTWYDLTIHWEPKLSFIYDEVGLRKLCTHEGFEPSDYRNFGYEALLQISRISTNIFFGKNAYNEDTSFVTPIALENLEDLQHSQCVTLGNMESKDLITYTIDELATYFNEVKEFSNPNVPNEILEPRIINKLKNLGNFKMNQAIQKVENWKKYSSQQIEKLRNLNFDVSKIFFKILEVGMYMRGWKVVSESYPLNEKLTFNSENDISKIENYVATSIREVFELLDTYKQEDRNVLEELPLMKVTIDNEVKSFIVTPDADDGKSIFERLKFVTQGDKHKNMKSCIRLTSNILLVSSYYYICALGLPEPFTIEDLDHIS